MPGTTSRRQVLGAGVAAGLVLGLKRHGVAAPRVQIDPISVISQQPDLYHGWPTMTRRRNGELLLVYSGGREAHVCPFGRVELIRSKDEGRTWSWPCVLWDSAIDDRDAGILETAKGTILVTTFTFLGYESILRQAEKMEPAQKGTWPRKKLQRWRAALRRLDAAQREALLGGWMIRSVDGGGTWSAPYRCPVNSPHGPIQLSDGRLLYAGKQMGYGTGRIGVCKSTNDGQTWRWLAEIPTRAGDSRKRYHEPHAVEAAEGRLILHIRNQNQANNRETLQSESSDGGQTWSVPHPIGVWGLPSHLLRLKDGRLLMSYGHRRPPLGNQTRLSEDHGRTWSEPMIISGDGTSTDLGYPSTVQLEDGSLLTVWYELIKESPKALLRQARWRIAG